VAGSEHSVLLVSSSGGVLLDLLALRPWWEQHVVHWVCVDAPDTRQALRGQAVSWAPELSPRHPIGVLRGVRRARRLLRSHDVDLVVSAGSGVAVPFFIAARTCGVRAWWVETFNVIGRPGIAARLCARLAHLVVVQHEHLLARHPRAVHVGELL
jgi:hypothetical protein